MTQSTTVRKMASAGTAVNKQIGAVLWFTGLSGSGKTTTAKHLAQQLVSVGHSVELLDGDELRTTICKGLGFSREERLENIVRITYVAKLLSRQGITVLVSAITPYQEMRDYARNELPGYVEIYVDCPLEECEKRDVKGLYAKARRNEIDHFTGISDPYERPEQPDVVINTSTGTIDGNSNIIREWLERKAALR